MTALAILVALAQDPTPIEIGADVPVTLASALFRVDVKEEKLLEAFFADVPAGRTLAMEILDPGGRLAARGRNANSACWRATPGAWTIRATDPARKPVDAPAHLRLVEAAAVDDPVEPNDAQDKATPVELSVPLRVQIRPAGDEDWFVVDVPSRGLLSCIPRAGPPGLSAETYVYDEKGKQIGARGCSVAAGRYWIVVRDDQLGSSPHRLAAEIGFVDAMDRWEPNDRKEDAAAVTLPAVIPFTTGRNDDDWFRITVPDDGILSVYVKFPGPAFKMAASLRPVGSDEIRPLDLEWPGVRLRRVAKGDYLLWVALHANALQPEDRFDPLALELSFYRKGEPIDLGFRLIGFGIENSPQAKEQMELIAELTGKHLLRGESVAEAVAAFKTAVTEERAKPDVARPAPTWKPAPSKEPPPAGPGALPWLLLAVGVAAAIGSGALLISRRS